MWVFCTHVVRPSEDPYSDMTFLSLNSVFMCNRYYHAKSISKSRARYLHNYRTDSHEMMYGLYWSPENDFFRPRDLSSGTTVGSKFTLGQKLVIDKLSWKVISIKSATSIYSRHIMSIFAEPKPLLWRTIHLKFPLVLEISPMAKCPKSLWACWYYQMN